MFDFPDPEVRYYPGSAWTGMLFLGGHTFETPPPLVTPEGIKPFPPTGARKRDLRTMLPPDIPEARFWSLTLYDNETRSILRLPRPTPTGRPPSTWVLRGRRGSPRATGSKTVPGKGWFIILRLYGLLASLFDKTWRPSEVQEVT